MSQTCLDRARQNGEKPYMVRLSGAHLSVLLCACHGADPIELPAAPVAVEANARGTREPLPGPVQALGLGVGYTCALLTGGAVKCWGSDLYGVLGQDTVPRDVSDPSRIAPIDFGDARAVVQLSVGWHHVCVLFDDERARCWGRNNSGQLGRGSTEDYGDDPEETLNVLADLPLEGIVQISAGVSNTCALVRSGAGPGGTVHCFGTDGDGAIGDVLSGPFGDDEDINALRPVELVTSATAIAVGDAVSCARLSTGPVQCWGSNVFGTLGIGITACAAVDEAPCGPRFGGVLDEPVKNLERRRVAELQLNQAHACIIDNNGELLCWGRNDQSRAGYPDALVGTVVGTPPGPVSLGAGVRVLGVGLGVRHGCALDVQGKVRCWGEAGPWLGYGMARQDGLAGVGGVLYPGVQYEQMEDFGAVDLGDTDDVPGIDPVLRLFSGGQHNCVILASGAVRCWGNNESGELGYGDYAQVGDIGGDGSTPAEKYEQLGRHDVCFSPPGVTTSCAN